MELKVTVLSSYFKLQLKWKCCRKEKISVSSLGSSIFPRDSSTWSQE